jgi:hypothetical protein
VGVLELFLGDLALIKYPNSDCELAVVSVILLRENMSE